MFVVTERQRHACLGFLLLFGCFSVIYSNKDVGDGETVIATEIIEDAFVYVTPKPSGAVHMAESFDDHGLFKSRWIVSSAKKDDTDESIAKYNGEWALEAALESGLKGDLGLVLKSKAKHHAISSKLNKPFVFDKKPLVVQYEVNFQNGQECGGAYIKLLTEGKDLNLKNFRDKTPYTIMFGPDKCGNDAKLHFIFQHRNPINGTLSEKHCKRPTGKIEEFFKDKKPHLYTLVLNPDNTFEILVDDTVVNEGNLLDDFTPTVNPPEEIDDPDDKKPKDWDEREKIADPDAKKPEDWDEDAPRQIADPSAKKPDDWLDNEPESIPDPNAVKPDDWDDEMDGEWEPPLISNPKCDKVGCGEWNAPLIDNPNHKGKWYPPTIDNPAYQGKWKARRIPNPDFFEDKNPFKMASIGAIGLELWSMSDGIYFDNIVITDNKAVADQWAKESFEIKRMKGEQDAPSFWEVFSSLAKTRPTHIWLLYFVYIGVPIVIYVRYVQNRVTEEGLIPRLLKYTNSHPWLWAVYVVVIGLPIVLIVVFCCSSSEEKKQQKKAAKAKKSDLSSPDDEPQNVEEIAEETVEGQDDKEDNGAGGDTVVESENKESAEEEEEEEEDEANKEEEEEKEDEEKEEEKHNVEEVPAGEPSGTPGRSPRRRKARKD